MREKEVSSDSKETEATSLSECPPTVISYKKFGGPYTLKDLQDLLQSGDQSKITMARALVRENSSLRSVDTKETTFTPHRDGLIH